jgi:sialic acid synthase SpsE
VEKDFPNMAASRIAIGQHGVIAPESPAWVVAEIGQNHNGDRALAEALIDAAAWAGADAIKLVKRDLDSELSHEGWHRPYDSQHAFGATYGEHRAALELSADDFVALRDRARHHGLGIVLTACDAASLKLAAEIEVDAIKIASRDLANVPLLELAARVPLPLIFSTGMSDLPEVDRAVDAIRRHTEQFVVMQCTSLYPLPLDEAHLRSLATLAARYDALVGFSDHSEGVLLAPIAVALGARVIEKHITLDRKAKGSDHAASLEPHDLKVMIDHIREVERSLGKADKPASPGVRRVRDKLGRSLVTRCPVPEGTRIEESMLVLKSPGEGLGWEQRHRVIGHRACRDLPSNVMLYDRDVIAE